MKQRGSKANRDNLLPRYGIQASKAFGVSMANLKFLAKQLGHDHALAAVLWETGWYEARMLASLVDEPAAVTSAQMDRWCRDFDNWAICDTVCFKLFDRAPHAWRKVEQWAGKRGEFGKRASFALLWALALHDKDAGDSLFANGLRLIEREANDPRNFVKKGINMALCAIGRRNIALNAAAIKVARRLSESGDAAARWNGRSALRELTSAAVTKRLVA